MLPCVQEYWLRGELESNRTYDAIIVGSGAAGGVAAARLCALGLNVLVLEAGQLTGQHRHPVTSAVSFALQNLINSGISDRISPAAARLGERALRIAGRIRQPVQSKCFAWLLDPDALVDDVDCPYITDGEDRFVWFRSRQPGGRMQVPGHGRQYYRLGYLYSGPDGTGLPIWPLDTDALDPWYRSVEQTLGLRGSADNVTGVAPSELAQVLSVSEAENRIFDVLKARWPHAEPILGRHAPPADWLDIADAAGKLSCRAGAVVRRVRVGDTGRAEGVEWFDIETQREMKASAPIVFLCASALESTRILMLSAGRPGADAVGLHSPALGKYLMDHAIVSGIGFTSSLPGIADQSTEPGRCIYLPPLAQNGGRFGMQIHIHPRSSSQTRIDIVSFAEMAADADNGMTLDPVRTDAYGVPVPRIHFRYSETQRAIARRQAETIRQIGSDLALKHLNCSDLLAPGSGIHECGTARMGSDPHTSVVDSNNECWDVKGLYVTDGACFPQLDVQNPTLAIMALSARAAEHAAQSAAASRHAAVEFSPLYASQ